MIIQITVLITSVIVDILHLFGVHDEVSWVYMYFASSVMLPTCTCSSGIKPLLAILILYHV